MLRISIKINGKVFHIDRFYVDLVSIKEYGEPYEANKEKTNNLVRKIAGSEVECVSDIHHALSLYCVPKTLQNKYRNSLK